MKIQILKDNFDILFTFIYSVIWTSFVFARQQLIRKCYLWGNWIFPSDKADNGTLSRPELQCLEGEINYLFNLISVLPMKRRKKPSPSCVPLKMCCWQIQLAAFFLQTYFCCRIIMMYSIYRGRNLVLFDC